MSDRIKEEPQYSRGCHCFHYMTRGFLFCLRALFFILESHSLKLCSLRASSPSDSRPLHLPSVGVMSIAGVIAGEGDKA